MKKRVFLSLAMVLVFAAVSAYGQTPTVKAPIDFPFTVEGKVLPAGTYEFTKLETGDVFRVMGEGKSVMASVLTRLSGAMRTAPKGTYLVFDKVGENYLLSEIWVPGDDGYLLLATKGPHGHKTVLMK
jgi:hypothetical protein